MNFFLTKVEWGVIIVIFSLTFIAVFLDLFIKVAVRVVIWLASGIIKSGRLISNFAAKVVTVVVNWFIKPGRHISNFAAVITKRFMGFVSKYRWLTVLIVIAVFASYPFICLGLHRLFNWNLGDLYTFKMSLEDFLTRWIAFWAFVGAGLNVLFLQRRVTVMDKQLRETRFVESVELLGNSNSSARIGGAYSLFYLAQDHEDLRKTICDILCAHVRNTTREEKFQERHKEEPSNEIQTVLDLLCKEDEKGLLIFDEYRKNLRKTFLCGADLKRANLQWANLWDANLRGAYLMNANLQEALLFNANLQGTNLVEANLQGANLNEANLQRADLNHANLQWANLWDANLQGANLWDANLQGAYLSDANFHGVLSGGWINWHNALKTGAKLEMYIF